MSTEIPAIMVGSPAREEVYRALVTLVDSFGPIEIEEKKTCLHLAVGGKAFLGVHPRKAGLRVTIPFDREIEDSRVVKAERVSKNRVHNDVEISLPSDLDPEVSNWIREAYDYRRQG